MYRARRTEPRPVAPLPSAVLGPGCQPYQGAQSLALAPAQLLQVLHRHGSRQFPDSGDTAVKVRPAARFLAALQGVPVLLVQGGNLLVQPFDVALGRGAHCLIPGPLQPVAFPHSLVDQLSAPAEQRLEFPNLRFRPGCLGGQTPARSGRASGRPVLAIRPLLRAKARILLG